MTSPLRTRFAPSPTGSLHVGGVRTALYCLLVARSTGGRFLLRIEDTDQARSTDEAARGILRDLRWLDVLWDEGPGMDDLPYGSAYQSQRLPFYRAAADKLLAEGKAYEAWESPAELDADRKAAEARKENFAYRRRPYTDAQIAAWKAEGRKPVIRFAAPLRAVTVPDLVLGDVTVEAGVVDDLVIVKADGFPTYHFAVVVDDHAMGVQLVLRGNEHLMNTHKHLLLYDAFGWTPPAHGHLPLISNPSGTKMSKRDKAKVARESARQKGLGAAALAAATGQPEADVKAFLDKKHDGVAMAEAIAAVTGAELPRIEVQDYRRGGYLPEALLNYLGLLGWSPGDNREILGFDEMVASFGIDRIIKTPAKFDVEKLLWMNAEYMKSLPEDRLHRRLLQWLEAAPHAAIGALDEARQRTLLAMYRPRARTFQDLARLSTFLFTRPTAWEPKVVEKHVANDGGWERLDLVRADLAALPTFDPATISAALGSRAEALGLNIGKVAQPVRVAITGDGVSPELADTLSFLGRDEVLARVATFQRTY